MDPVEEFAQLKDTIRRLEARANVLRDGFLRPGVRLCSNRHEVVVRQQTRKLLQKNRLPPDILNDPRYWLESTLAVVTVRDIGATGAASRQSEEITLIEPFD